MIAIQNLAKDALTLELHGMLPRGQGPVLLGKNTCPLDRLLRDKCTTIWVPLLKQDASGGCMLPAEPWEVRLELTAVGCGLPSALADSRRLHIKVLWPDQGVVLRAPPSPWSLSIEDPPSWPLSLSVDGVRWLVRSILTVGRWRPPVTDSSCGFDGGWQCFSE